jgi:hypothetical protein
LPLLNSRSRAAELLPLTPAAAVPLLFLHRKYQAQASLGPIDIFGSDLAIAVVVAAALVIGWQLGWAPLWRPRALWIAAGALLALFVSSCFWSPPDQTQTHLITAAKEIEYALLAPALVLLLRRRIDVERLLLVLVGWSAAATGWGALQFLGLVNEFEGKRPDQREVSFLGIEDFAALSGAALVITLVCIALGERRRMAVVAGVAGALGMALAASVLAFAGLALAGLVIAVVGRRAGTLSLRRLLVIGAIGIVTGAGVYGLRAGDVTSFFGFLKTGTAGAPVSEGVQTGSQRVMLSYLGLRMWEDHPLLGVGFQRSSDHYGPYIADAKKQFPAQNAFAFPTPKHEWGVQNYWVQLLADVGIVGFVLGILTFAAGLVLALRAPPHFRLYGLIAAGWILLTIGSLNAIGIVAGLPLDALVWIGLGLGATVGGLE